jgi:hypothetical protein
MIRSLFSLVAIAVLATSVAVGCTSSPGRPVTATGSAGAQAGTAGTSGAAGGGAAGTGAAGSGAAGSVGSAGSTTGTSGASGGGSAGSVGTAGAAGSQPDAATSMDAAAGASGTDAGSKTDTAAPPFDAAGRTPPTCKTPKPNPNGGRASECDYLLQSLDFDDMYSYPSPAGSITVTNYGTAFGLYEINNCGPYCYTKALTVGVDIVGGDASSLQGEIIVHFPTTGPGLPITTAIGRDSLAWIELDGPTMPPFKITGQMVFETPAGIVTGTEVKALAYNNWLNYQAAEFKYFGLKQEMFSGPPVNVTGIGFRIAAPAGLAKGMEWHGVAYIDHLQIRSGAAPANPPGGYPYGLK